MILNDGWHKRNKGPISTFYCINHKVLIPVFIQKFSQGVNWHN